MIVNAIVQARMQSIRLPGKVLLDFGGCTVLENVVRRVGQSKVDRVIVATSPDVADDPIADLCIRKGIPVIRAAGQNDVFRRFLFALSEHPCHYFARITADCPLISPIVLDTMLKYAQMLLPPYITATTANGIVNGLDCEIVRTELFQSINPMELSVQELEHCTLALQRYTVPVVLPGLAAYRGPHRLVLDTPDDYAWLMGIIAKWGNDPDVASLLASISSR